MMRPILPAILLFAVLFGPVASTEAQTFDLAVSPAGSGAGTVSSSPAGVDCGATCTGTFSQSTLVALTAAPNDASVFVGWTGACNGKSTCVLTMDAAKSVTATFGSLTYEKLYSFNGTTDGAAPVAPLIQATDGFFYGTTELGGADGCGTVFRTDGSSTPTTLHSFTQEEGCFLPSALLQASDGLFYGVSRTGGPWGDGTLFKMDSNGDVTVVHVFQSLVPDNGAFPYAALIQGSDGYFYGTTTGGGAHFEGSVFRADANGGFTVLHSFDSSSSSGYQPYAPLIQASDGTFYGTTSLGGDPNGPCEDCNRFPGGTVFQMDASGNVTYLFNFAMGGGNGDTPLAGLLQTGPTTFYGTTSNLNGLQMGLSEYVGTVFVLDTSADWGGLYTVHEFDYNASLGFPEGALPASDLIRASDGNIYGTTLLGGGLGTSSGQGVVFRLDAASHVAVLHAFDGDSADGDSGSKPGAALVQGVDGHLYGTAPSNSLFLDSGPPGTLFRLNLDLSGPVKTNQTITFAALADKTFGDPDFVIAATSSSSLLVAFTPGGSCSMSGTSVHLTGPGTCTITASQPGDANYNAAPSVQRSFTIATVVGVTLSLSPAAVTGGTTSTGTVTLTSPAPAGGVIVNLASDTPGAATVPATVSIMRGKTTKTFTVKTFVVATATPVTVSASYGGTTATSLLTVNPSPSAASALTLNPKSVKGGVPSSAKVTLSGPAPAGGLLVTMVSSNPAVAASTSVVVPAGSTSATVSIATFTVNKNTSVTITATGGGVAKTATLTVTK